MLIRMTNPKHGAMHVYSESDALAHEKLGWVRDVEAKPAPVQPAQAPQPDPVAQPRKYGRKGV